MQKLNLPKSTNELLDALRQQLRAQAFIYKFLQIIVGALFPVIEAFLVNKVSADNSAIWVWFLLIFIGAFHLCLLSLLVWTEKPLTQFLVEFDNQAQELKISQTSKDVMESFYISFREALITTEFSLVSLKDIINQPTQYLSDIFSLILAPWINSRTEIFGFDNGNALYNMAVYLLNQEKDVLEIAFRQCDDRIIRKDREWKAGVGHVGMCFSKGETQYCKDLTLAEIPSTTNQELSRPEDVEYYGSVIAEPIKIDQDVVGVFIITSSQPGQFDEDIHIPCVRVLAQLLGLAYQLVHAGGY